MDVQHNMAYVALQHDFKSTFKILFLKNLQS